MTQPARIRQIDYLRRIKALRKAVGDPDAPVKIEPDGSVVLLTPRTANDPAASLDEEIAAWSRKHGYG